MVCLLGTFCPLNQEDEVEVSFLGPFQEQQAVKGGGNSRSWALSAVKQGLFAGLFDPYSCKAPGPQLAVYTQHGCVCTHVLVCKSHV